MTPTVKLIDTLLNVFRRLLSARLVERLDKAFTLVGGYGIYVLILVVVMSTLTIAMQSNVFDIFILGLLFIPLGLVGQYVSVKMLTSVDRLIASTRTDLTSSGFLDVLAVFALVMALLSPFAGLYAALQLSSFEPFLGGVLAFFLLLYSAAVALNPGLVNVRISGDASVGQEAIGVVTFAIKALYRFTPIAFGALVIVANVLCVVAVVQAVSNDVFVFYTVRLAQPASVAAVVLPFIAYVVFLLVFVIIDIYRAILSVAQVAEGYRRPAPPREAG